MRRPSWSRFFAVLRKLPRRPTVRSAPSAPYRADVRLLVVRHAIAEDPAVFAATGRSDAERPLTEKGRRRMRRVARGLKKLVPAIDGLATSPLVRAVETAE